MICFLTSSPGGYTFGTEGRIPCPLDDANGFVAALRQHWPDTAQLLFIASDPDNPARLDEIAGILARAFPLSGLPVSGFQCCDRRNASRLAQLLAGADVVVLCGGHVPTQHRFFQQIDLKAQLAAFDGILIGISAGTMNAAELVYAQPELEGEALDGSFQRWLPGLSLTPVRVLPHLQALQDETLDGLRLIEDISLPDSRVHPFYGLPDGSWLSVTQGITTLHGPAVYFAGGTQAPVCGPSQTLQLT